MDLRIRGKLISTSFERLQQDMICHKNEEAPLEKQFKEQLENLERLIHAKVAKLKYEASTKAKQLIKENTERLADLKTRFTKSADWFRILEHDEKLITKYEKQIKEFSEEVSRLITPRFSIIKCKHITDFINSCGQIVDVVFGDNSSTSTKQDWTCNELQEREESAFLIVTDRPSEIDIDLPDPEPIKESVISDITKYTSDCIPGSENANLENAIKAITVSNDGHIVVVDTEQRAYLSFDSDHRFIKRIKFNQRDYPHDVDFLESKETIVSTVTNGQTNYVIRVLSLAGNRNSFRKVGSPLTVNCHMFNHCLSVSTNDDDSFVVCIVCPQELRLIAYDKHGRVNMNIPNLVADINDRSQIDLLKHKRYTVKLNKNAIEAYVIKSDIQSLICFRLEEETFGEIKWKFECEDMNVTDLCVYETRVFVTDNANGNILEFETVFGKLTKTICLHSFGITHPFAICMKRNQILLSQFSNTDSLTRTKKRTITVLSFKDYEPVIENTEPDIQYTIPIITI